MATAIIAPTAAPGQTAASTSSSRRSNRRIAVLPLLSATLSCCSLELAVGHRPAADCSHCEATDAFEEFLKADQPLKDGEFASTVHMLWPAHVEVVPITSDLGGWEPPSFHENLAKAAIAGWRKFQTDIIPRLPKKHPLHHQLNQRHAGALNDGFFHWQKTLFEVGGDVPTSLKIDPPVGTPDPDDNTSWPEMNALPEYQRLRKIVERLSRKFLIRSGLAPQVTNNLNYSMFNWCAVHGPGEFHGPHTHVGEYHVAVFYAQVGPAGGKLRFGDPRGHGPPFGRHVLHTPEAGHLVIFPSWLSHMATVTSPESDLPREYEDEPLRVTFPFNIGPETGPLPCHKWWEDPTGDMHFHRQSKIDFEEMGL
eukprot:CAMPEP_0206491436 /NCGR_PEP_ID=MMETSP0324_2-20121206/44997_1 /ASSEMBLY_ACC=CAM_ASM_000836 /TAXON_ID=2866 /ORGANISM="Crypthecodinium cohnii, Strain Seligo" /LENGTH=365 /DNA_ID=CAMNT_0053972631 /DNA_START=13 /DNA_END=1110 /DNA_ORIENTATION=+